MYFYTCDGGIGIGFKSIPKYYIKEMSGLKPNTVRKLSVDEQAQFDAVEHKIVEVKITNTDTMNYFRREITDISTFPLELPYTGVMHIISWEHKIWSYEVIKS